MNASQRFRLGRTLTVIALIVLFTIDFVSEWYLTVGYFAVAMTGFYLLWTGSEE